MNDSEAGSKWSKDAEAFAQNEKGVVLVEGTHHVTFDRNITVW